MLFTQSYSLVVFILVLTSANAPSKILYLLDPANKSCFFIKFCLKRFSLYSILQVAEYLHEEHKIPRDQAAHITQTFLKAFRLCPDNPECDLNTWRCHLWSTSLTVQYSHLTQNVYLKWLHLRYYYLSIDDNVKRMLINLRKQYLLGLITNGPSSAQWEKVERLNLMPLFDCILVSGDLPWAKPDQKIFLKACKYLGVEPKRCVMIGDKLETDIQVSFFFFNIYLNQLKFWVNTSDMIIAIQYLYINYANERCY